MSVDALWEHEGDDGHGLRAICRRVGQGLLEASGHGHRELVILLTDDASIRALNHRWRDVDSATDVLSFPNDSDMDPVGKEEGAVGPIGDVAISVDTATRQAADHGLTLTEEVTFLVVHAYCHLLGHDHGDDDEARVMRDAEDRLLAIVAPDQPRPPTPY